MDATNTADKKNVVEYIRLLQNPYAKLSLIGGQENKAVAVSDPKRKYYKNLQNPWAYDSIFCDEEEQQLPLIEELNPISAKAAKKQGISKKEFADGCRRIFLQYTPPSEGRMLRPHFRDFIIRNEKNPGHYRSKLLNELTKYDLSLDGNFKPHFNRETELLTANKLQKIELAAKSAD